MPMQPRPRGKTVGPVAPSRRGVPEAEEEAGLVVAEFSFVVMEREWHDG